ncbi:MAG: O-antigen ligase family protein, partial [Rhodospirillaceae bacterium]|nr:O-antigen ligase family protein [Rhodospirillaceae bacterium]
QMIKRHWLIAIIISLWLISISISFFNSPYDVMYKYIAVQRYLQTITHVIFFICIRDYVTRYPVQLKPLFLAISMAGIFVLVVMAVLLIGEDFSSSETSYRWMHQPPLNLNIRHTGYLIAAAIGAGIGLCFLPNITKIGRVGVILLLTLLVAFMFWTGGRGPMVSALSAFVIIGAVVHWKGNSVRFFLIAFVVSFIFGAILAEIFAVFPWNGLSDSVSRSVGATTLNELGSNRIEIWLATWDTIKQYPLFGLGSFGYVFMPNHVFGFHPHSFILQFLIEWGAVGTLLIISALIIGFYNGLRAQVIDRAEKLNPIIISVGGVLLSLGVLGLVDGTLFYPQPTLYLVMALAIWTSPQAQEK